MLAILKRSLVGKLPWTSLVQLFGGSARVCQIARSASDHLIIKNKWRTPTHLFRSTYVLFNLCTEYTIPGYDALLLFLFKENITCLAKIVTKICNESMLQRMFPNELPTARVTCIYESGYPINPEYCRTMSFLSVFSKILETIVEIKLHNHLDNNHLRK